VDDCGGVLGKGLCSTFQIFACILTYCLYRSDFLAALDVQEQLKASQTQGTTLNQLGDTQVD
jgi:hypothetical protein